MKPGNYRRVLLVSVLSIVTAGTAFAKEERFAPPEEIASLIQQLMHEMHVPGLAIAKIEQGQVAWIGSYGSANERRLIDQDSVFNIASLTKPLFSMVVMHAVSEQQFDLDTPLKEYWVNPDLAEDLRLELLTARLVMSHQSGLPNWRGNQPLSFMFTPGTRHEYSGEGFEYLQRAIETSTKKSLTELMRQYITKPLNLNDTYFGWNDSIENKFAMGFDEEEKSIGLDATGIRYRTASSACCTFTTIADYAKFVAWVAVGAGLSDDLYTQLQTSQAQHKNPAEYFGLGWRLVQLKDRTVLSHDGREEGVRTLTYVDRKSKSGLVIFTNSSNGELLMRPIVESVMDNGSNIMHRTDVDVWCYFQSLPSEGIEQVIEHVAGSPSFASKLLYAIDATLIETSNTADKVKISSQKIIDDLVMAAHNGTVTQAELIELFSLLKDGDGKNFQLKSQFTSQQAAEWVSRIEELISKSRT